MFTNVFKALGAAGLLIAAACGAETAPSSTSQALVGDAAVPTSLQLPDDVRAESPVADRLRAQTNVAEQCTFQVCAADEQCCAHTGECVPVDCDDCCTGPELAGEEPTDPEIIAPQPPPEPR